MSNWLRALCLFICIVVFTSACRRYRKDNVIENRQFFDEEVPSITIIGSPDNDVGTLLSDSSDNILISYIQGQVANHLLNRSSYIVSYNPQTRCPNWVAWHLIANHIDGIVPRFNDYNEDNEVPVPRATNEDYRGTQWSRGHMCPAGDNKWDSIAMRETFLLTNICPQHRSLNSGLWNRIEQDCRKWAKKYGDIYIVCGPVLLNREHETIGDNKVVVPEAFFKVILCLQGKPKAIGFVVRNNEGTKKRDQFVNTIDDVERITGIDFFPALPDDIENEVEAYANLDDWRL